jgi:hypothetical protein
MDRNWNRGNGSNSSSGGEKIYRQPYTGNQHHYRKKNDYSGQEYYNKNVKHVSSHTIVKKESLQIALVENELMDHNFSWLKNVGSAT